jgi:hypothetical protein
VLLGPKLAFPISREFTPGFRNSQYLLTLRLTGRIASQRITLGGVSSVFFNLAHGGKVKHSNPVLVEAEFKNGREETGRAVLGSRFPRPARPSLENQAVGVPCIADRG